MSGYLTGLVLKTGLKANRKLVLIALADHAHDDGTRVFPKMSNTARRASCSIATVDRVLSEHRKSGLLIIHRKAKGHSPNHYHINVALLKQMVEDEENKEVPQNEVPKVPQNEVAGTSQLEVPGTSQLEVPIRNVKLTVNEKEIDYNSIMERWNEFARMNGISTIRTMTDKRKRGIRARHKHVNPHINTIYSMILESDFLMGKTIGRDGRKFRMSFDFVWDTAARWNDILEGKYINERSAAVEIG